MSSGARIALDFDALDFNRGGGVVTVVTQDARTGVVLMVAHADKEALERSIATGVMHYRSRTRGLWRKGDTSGNTQAVVSLDPDCDGDSVLARVVPAGPACHTGAVASSRCAPRPAAAMRRAPIRATPGACSTTATCASRRSARKRPSWSPRAPTAIRGAPPKRAWTCSTT
jgi:phosphoribosyl-ATP pyrophosphohydrolase/phosphoribosyl-AMP cyclohydrolase